MFGKEKNSVLLPKKYGVFSILGERPLKLEECSPEQTKLGRIENKKYAKQLLILNRSSLQKLAHFAIREAS